MANLNSILKAGTTAGLQTLIEKVIKPRPSIPSCDVDYEDGGSMAERMKASGFWHLLPEDIRADMEHVRVVFHVDRKTRRIVGTHFKTQKGGEPPA